VGGTDAEVVDVVFAVAGESLPADHAHALLRETVRCLPWFESDPWAGIHPLRTAPTTYGVALLARRAKLVLRLTRGRLADARALEGLTLDIAGNLLQVGAGTERPLRPFATLHALRVVTGARDEKDFHGDVVARLETLGIDCDFISGRRQALRRGDQEMVGFSLALHGLNPDDSLRVQREGVGDERRLGCGIFIPHKSIVVPD
jgi:CRISPR-associated protein Cas6